MKLALPADFRDLTIAQYRTLTTTRDPLEWVSVCSGTPVHELREAPHKLLDRAVTHLEVLMEQQTARHEKVLQIGDMEFGFIPDWDAFTTGEWIDMETYVKDLNQNATQIMSLLYRPITARVGDRYEIAPYTAKEDASIFEDVSADLYAGVLLFFSTIRNELLSSTRQSLEEAAEVTIRSLRSGVGTKSYTSSQGKAFWKWIGSRASRFRSRSNTYPTFKTYIK